MEAAVIAIPHPKWDERPLLIVVPHSAGPPPTPEDVLAFMQVGSYKTLVWLKCQPSNYVHVYSISWHAWEGLEYLQQHASSPATCMMSHVFTLSIGSTMQCSWACHDRAYGPMAPCRYATGGSEPT